MLRRERPDRRGLALLLALTACAAVSILHRQSEAARGTDMVTGSVRDMALVPAQGFSVSAGRWWHDTVTASFEGPVLARRNRALSTQVHGLLSQNKELLGAQMENTRLRRLLRFQQKSSVPLLASEVLAIDPNAQSDMLILSRGSREGVRARTIAIAPNGALVGQVLEVSPRSCSVLLLTDSSSSVGAQVVRRTAIPDIIDFSAETSTDPLISKTISIKNGPIGICQGSRAGHITLTYLSADADVQVGDLVTTSGLGGVFPKGLAIGTVEAVAVDKTRSVKTARLRPSADLDHLEEVFLRIKPSLASVTDDPVSATP